LRIATINTQYPIGDVEIDGYIIKLPAKIKIEIIMKTMLTQEIIFSVD